MSLPLEMTVVEIAAPGGPEQLKNCQRPVPEPEEGEVLVRVAAAGVNRPDVMQRQGRYPPPPGASDLPGLEIAGEIVALGPKVTGRSVGEAVTALLPAAAMPPMRSPRRRCACRFPRASAWWRRRRFPRLSSRCGPIYSTAGRCKAGETVLIHGGTSGIGTTAIQLAAAWGARVFATAGSDDKARACERLGAVRGINYRTEDFVEVMRAQTGGKGVDVSLDMVAGSYVPRNLDIAALEGRVVVISLLGGSRAEINMGLILTKRLTLTGSTLRDPHGRAKSRSGRCRPQEHWPMLVRRVECGRSSMPRFPWPRPPRRIG